jgi:hypothetical protein
MQPLPTAAENALDEAASLAVFGETAAGAIYRRILASTDDLAVRDAVCGLLGDRLRGRLSLGGSAATRRRRRASTWVTWSSNPAARPRATSCGRPVR